VAQVNEESTNSFVPNPRKVAHELAYVDVNGVVGVCRLSMPQVIPAGLVPRWHRHNEDRAHRFE
jgi:hypothetical protein